MVDCLVVEKLGLFAEGAPFLLVVEMGYSPLEAHLERSLWVPH